MRYLYTTQPDDGCREVEKGIYGRPVQTSDEAKLRERGWSLTIDAQRGKTHGVRKEQKEERQESEEVKSDTEKAWEMPVDELQRRVWSDKYQAKFGKKPHHKLKTEKIRAKVESDD